MSDKHHLIIPGTEREYLGVKYALAYHAAIGAPVSQNTNLVVFEDSRVGWTRSEWPGYSFWRVDPRHTDREAQEQIRYIVQRELRL